MPTPFEVIREALADRYRLERELGRGGYAVVYLAHDRKYDRDVAIKVLNPELALGVRTERFLREIQIAAKLNHPHILTLLDSGEANGLPYYVMHYVRGESLRDRLKREKQLSIDETIRITRDVASALTAAHAAGVVHRDVKPENILLEPTGEAVVADFGIARALTVAAGDTITDTHHMPGTPAYMSPEQASGGEVDGRSDVYSLGCVTYEMVAGHPPFTGATAQEVLSRHLLDPVPSLRAARTAVPDSLETTIRRALAKQPADRFGTPSDFVAALSSGRKRWGISVGSVTLAAIVLLLIAGGIIGWWQWSRLGHAGTVQSVAIRPFTPLMTDPESEYLSQGITEDLTAALTAIEGLRIIPVHPLEGRPLPSGEDLYRTVGATRVVDGTVRKGNGRLRVTVGMTDARNGAQVWAASYERDLKDAITVQVEIAAAIARALRINLAASGLVLSSPPPRDREAQEAYQRGRLLYMRRTRNDILKAIDYFRQAVARDSEYALAWSALSDALQNAGQFRYLPRLAAWAEAEKAALRAIAVDSMLSEAHLSLGRIRETATWDDAGADAEYRLAIKFNPKSPAAHGYYAGSLAVRGKCDQAVEEASTAVGLDVLDAIANVLLPNTLLFCQRDLDRAEKLYHQLIDLQPDWATAHGQLGLLYLRKGMLDSAAAEFAIGAKLNPSGTVYPARLGYALARLGRRDSALVLLRRLEARLPDPAVFTSLAELRIGLGDTTTALAWLDSAVRSRDLLRGPLLAAMWDPTRSDPRFRAILARVGLTQ